MATGNLVKRLQNIMRQDPGISGDAQRIEQMVWIFFLKVYDAQEREWEFVASSNGKKFLSIIPERFRWRNWAVSKDEEGKERGDILTGDSLLAFINELFAALKSLEITPETPRSKAIVKEVFADLNQYQKNGILLRQIVNIVDEIDFSDAQDRHTFGDIYEQILKDLQGAGRAGEFYTPRAVTDFIISRLKPRIGQTIGDFASGTGGFLVSGLRYLQDQIKTIEDEEKYQNSIIGQEWKPFPYLLCITNLLVNGIESPNVRHMDSLGKRLKDWEDDCDIIAMNPPYGGSTEASVKSNFPSAFQTSETADLFILLIMQRLRRGGRAGVVIPDGFLFGTDGAKLAIKQKLLKEFNLHTIVRLPPSVFSPYTGIATNIIFFDRPEATPQDGKCATKETWVYRLDMPEGCKHFSKTKPMKIEHFAPAVEWWSDRKEIVGEEIGEKAKKFTASELAEELGYNLDQCGYPHVEEEILAPMDLIQRYQEERSSLNAEIDRVLAEITEKLGGAQA